MEDKEEVITSDKENEVKKVKKKNKPKNDELEKLRLENATLNDKCLRLNAEMQNLMRRSENERASLIKYAGEEIIKGVLEVLDDFERALNMDDDNPDDEVSRFLEGFKIIYNNLIKTLESFGVKECICLGEEFDPSKMNAVLTEKNSEYPSNAVIEVLQKGYSYNEKIIRPAMVKVNE